MYAINYASVNEFTTTMIPHSQQAYFPHSFIVLVPKNTILAPHTHPTSRLIPYNTPFSSTIISNNSHHQSSILTAVVEVTGTDHHATPPRL